MRAFGLEIGRARELAAADPPKGSIGIDGDSPFTDLIAGGFDATPEMSGHRKYRTIEEMRKTDAMIRSIIFMYKLPIRSADWGLEPADDDPDHRIADACARQFGLEDYEGALDLTWGEWTSQTLLYIELGAIGEELIWSPNVELWNLGAGPDGQERPPLLIRPVMRFAPRFPSTIDEIKADSLTGRIKSVRQGLVSNAVPIPTEINGVRKLVWYSHEREGSNWWGTSLLRAMYGPWRLKKSVMIAGAIGWDRFSSGVPVVRYPKGAGAKAKREAEQAARNYRTHERAWITFEGTEAEGWNLDIVGGSQTLADPTPLIGLYNEEMATAALQIFSRLGTSHHGSRAVGQVLADPYYLAVQSYAKDLAKTRERTALRAFIDVNFGPEWKTPTVSVSKIQAQNIVVLAQSLQYLAAAGLNFTDRQTQNDIRDQLDLRHLPEPVAAAIDSLPDDVGIEDAATDVEDPYNVPTPGEATPAAAMAGYVAREGDGLGY